MAGRRLLSGSGLLRRLFASVAFLAVVASLVAVGGVKGRAQDDRDRDGITDCQEELLGTDPEYAERLQVVLEDGVEAEQRRRQPGYDATKDVVQVEFCHVGGDRYLWRVTLAAPPRLDETVLHLYVDGDADASTGRNSSAGSAVAGTEYMLSIVGGRGTSGQYDSQGNRRSGPPVSFAVDGNRVLISADVELGRGERGIRYGLYVLCHTLTSAGQQPAMSDSTAKRLIDGVPVSARPKRMRPTDYRNNHRVAATFGHDLLLTVLKRPGTIVVRHDQLGTDGFTVDQFTTRRWPHVRRQRPGGKVWTTAPKAGRYHVGFMMYDDANDERVAIYVEGHLQGVAVANQDNNTTWLYWLAEAYQFKGGERVELRGLGSSGRHGICNILFLDQPPPVRAVRYRVENMTAVCPVGRPGHVVVSWTTTWPCPTQFEFGRDTSYGKVIEQSGHCLAHRVVLEGLEPGVEYHGRAVGVARDGQRFYGSDFVFRAAPPPRPPTRVDRDVVPLTVRNPHKVAAKNWPVTAGVPFPQGQLGSPDHVRLVTGDGEVPLQVRVTGHWPDGSVKWLLLSFQANVPAEGQRMYRLEFGRQVRRSSVAQPVRVQRTADGELAVDAGLLSFRVDRHGNLTEVRRSGRPVLIGGGRCRTTGADAAGRRYQTGGSPAELTVEESGPLRAVVKVVSHLTDGQGRSLLRIEKRIEAYRAVPFIRISHRFIVDRPEKFTELRALTYQVPVAAAGQSWRVPVVGGEPVRLTESQPAVWQRFDDQFAVIGPDSQRPTKGRIVGAMIGQAGDGNDAAAFVLRDFWQNYPKGFRIRRGGVAIELCPPFEPGLYDRFPFQKEGHHLYYYLLNGRYRLKRGVAKTHELLLCFDRPGAAEAACTLFQRPPLAAAPPRWYCHSKAFYGVAARDTEKFGRYEQAIERNLRAYQQRRERQHDFGMLNYGDWYGERGTNWGNIEYDTQHAFFLEYIRSGNPEAFFLAEATELHNRDIDTVQWSDDPTQVGAVYVHQMCHVGEYYDKPVPGSLGFPRGGYTVSHAWVEGHFDHYFLTGDRRSFETAVAAADYFVRRQLGRPYDFSTCRTPGWHLIMLAAAYHATGDPYYLNAAKVVVQRVLETQERQPRPLPDYQQAGRQPFQVGGWSRMMVPGHCRCQPRHRGNAGFMVAILLSGLKYYHDVTGDPEVKEAIIRGADYLLDETYSDRVHGFRYTSCPKTGYHAGATPLMVEGIARAYLWTRKDRFRRVLTEALPLSAAGSSYGKGFSMYYRIGPRVLADLEAADLAPFAAADRR